MGKRLDDPQTSLPGSGLGPKSDHHDGAHHHDHHDIHHRRPPDRPGRPADVLELDPAIADQLAAAWWPMARLDEGLAELARRSGLLVGADPPAASVDRARPPDDEAQLARWLAWQAARLGLDAEPVDSPLPELPALLRRAGPALLLWHGPRGPGFLLLLRSRRGVPQLLDARLRRRPCSLATLRQALCWPAEAPLMPDLTRFLADARVPLARRPAVLRSLLQQRLADHRISGCWLLRLPASAGFARQLGQAGLWRRLGWMLALFGLMYGLELTGWGLMGEAVLLGRLDMGWMTAWLLLMLTMVPLHLLGGWLNANLALDAGRLLKQRLLAGALRLAIDGVRRQGVGHLLGRVIESQALEALALSGGLGALVALLELLLAGTVLALGAAGALHLGLLALWLAVTGWLGWRMLQQLRRWTLQRLDLTHALVERMVGHRTRLAQEQPARRDADEDQALNAYLHDSHQMDRLNARLLAGLPDGWLLLGLAGLLPAFVQGGASLGTLAISLGGVLMAQRAFGSLADGLGGLARALVAWQQVGEMFRAGQHSPPRQAFIARAALAETAVACAKPARSAANAAPGRGAPGQPPARPLVDAQALRFGYRSGRLVLDGATLTIQAGERILLEGPSGGGKSTLAALLTGLRQPQGGLLLINGLDRATLGDQWHQLATSAPQFHENHVLSGSLGFNLLMGRDWPASTDDLAEAQALCDELGLGDLLARMPAGLLQAVGETGWQLSHGERSRLFLARALLQKAPLTILDESFAALDPHTLSLCLQCAMRRAHTLVVIAHP